MKEKITQTQRMISEAQLKNNTTVEEIYRNYKILIREKGKTYATNVLKKILKHLFDSQEMDLIHNLLLANRKNKIMDENSREMLHLAIILSKNIRYNIEHAPYSPTEKIFLAHERVVLHSKDPKASIKFLMTCKSDKVSEHLSFIKPHNLEEALQTLEEEYRHSKKESGDREIYQTIKNDILQKKKSENLEENKNSME